MERYYEFAGVGIAIRVPDAIMFDDERSLAPFRVDNCEDPHRFTFEIVENLPVPSGVRIAQEPAFAVYQDGDWTVRYIGAVQSSWESAYIRVAHSGKEHRVHLKASSYPDRIGPKTVLNCMAAEHLVAENRGFILHSSFIGAGERGIVFTAPSGTGKSTQADLWQQHRGARILNGDRSALRVTDAGVRVCGIPFSGSSTYCENVTLPLTAVVYLKQAPQTTIRRLRGAEAFRRVWEGVSVNAWDRKDVLAVSAAVEQLLQQVPVFELACTPDESAVLALEGALGI